MSDISGVFNLIESRWLPVRRRSGATERVAPWQVTDGWKVDPIAAFDWPRPDFNGACHELLIGLLSTTAAPEDDGGWEDWWHEPPPPDVLRERFSTLAHAFDLDGPGPRFLQDVDRLEEADAKGVSALLIDAPGAQTVRNNADLFVKRGGVPVIGRAAAAMALFTLSSYAPSGGAGHRTSLRGGGPMTTLVVADHGKAGNTLWGRLWPNVVGREQVGMGLDPDAMRTVFPWLDATRTSNPKAGGRATTPNDVHPLHVYWAMPRRIRLVFEKAEGRRCCITNRSDSIVVSSYRTRNYGANYSEGFEHPLTPHYRQKASAAVKLPVHPNAGGITYRLWPGLVVPSRDGLRQPAQVVRHWLEERVWDARPESTRFVAFGYDMDNMKACAWLEGEMPLTAWDDAMRDRMEGFVGRATAGAGTVARLITTAVKSARHDRPKDAPGDYGHVAASFYRQTEGQFREAVRDAEASIRKDPDADDPTRPARERWAVAMARSAASLFDELVPMDGLEDRNMHRHVAARFQLTLALGGRGKAGKSLFEADLGIVPPQTVRARAQKKEAA